MKIIKNAIRCLGCHLVIESKHVHDYQECDCGLCAVDGGLQYLKRSGSEYEDLSIVEEEEKMLNEVVLKTKIPLDEFFETIIDELSTQQKEELIYMIEKSLNEDEEDEAQDFIITEKIQTWDNVRK